MNDEDDTPPPPNGRITVTLGGGNSNNLAPALPKANGGGREDCWSEGATAVLISAWGERYLELSRGNLKQKHWKEVAEIVSGREEYTKTAKTDIQCKNRIDTVKKKYKLEKAKIAAGGGPSTWPFFERLDRLIGPTAAKTNNNNNSSISGSKLVPPLAIAIPVGLRSGGSGGGSNNQYRFDHGKLQIKSNYQVGNNQNLNNQSNNSNSNNNVKLQVRKRVAVDTESSSSSEEEEGLMESDDSLPPRGKRGKVVAEREVGMKGGGGKEKGGGWGNSIRMLTQAILKFGEAYEHAENAKLQQVVEMEKTRMKFAKELELQRMQFFMKTQMEISQLRQQQHGRRGGSNVSNHHGGNNIVINNNINSDSEN